MWDSFFFHVNLEKNDPLEESHDEVISKLKRMGLIAYTIALILCFTT